MRKHVHGFHHQITDESKEMVCGQNLTKNFKSFLVSDDDYVEVHDAENFHETYRFTCPLSLSENPLEPIEIIGMKISRTQNYLAILTGKNLQKEVEEIHQIIVYKVLNETTFEIVSTFDGDQHRLPDEFRNYSKTLEFCNDEEHCKILMTNEKQIVKFDYTKSVDNVEVYCKFVNFLKE